MSISTKKRANVFALTCYCFYCGREDATTIDHIVPQRFGGDDDYDNLVPACGSCNSRKGTRSIEEFRQREFERRGDIDGCVFFGEFLGYWEWRNSYVWLR